jgi:hypothetical protein
MVQGDLHIHWQSSSQVSYQSLQFGTQCFCFRVVSGDLGMSWSATSGWRWVGLGPSQLDRIKTVLIRMTPLQGGEPQADSL